MQGKQFKNAEWQTGKWVMHKATLPFIIQMAKAQLIILYCQSVCLLKQYFLSFYPQTSCLLYVFWSGFNFDYAVSSTSPDNITNCSQLPGKFQCDSLSSYLYHETLFQPDGIILIQDLMEALSQRDISINTLTEKITNIII